MSDGWDLAKTKNFEHRPKVSTFFLMSTPPLFSQLLVFQCRELLISLLTRDCFQGLQTGYFKALIPSSSLGSLTPV